MVPRIDPTLLSRINERRVLEVVQAHGPSSRAELTRRSGISAPTVSKSVEALLGSGFLEEADGPRRSLGRPGRLLRLASEGSRVLGLVLDARRCALVAAGIDGQACRPAAAEFATPRRYGALLEAVVERARPLLRERGVRTLGLGISLPGLVDARRGRGLLSPNLHLTDGRSPGRDLAERLGIDCVVRQEANALCLAEWLYGAARGMHDVALLDATTGLGLGVVAGGRLLEGAHGLAGELGHASFGPGGASCGCGNRGCLETVATDAAVARGVPRERAREALAGAVGAVVNLFNPQAVFVHARLIGDRPADWERFGRAVRRRSLAPSLDGCRIEPARGNKRQGAVASVICHLVERLGPRIGNGAPEAVR